MIVYDELNDAMYFKDVLSDARQVEVSKSDGSADRKGSHINKFVDENGIELIDLDNSVFMNFQQFSKKNLDECYNNDRLFSKVAKIVSDEDDYENLMDLLCDEYEMFCEFFQTVSAEFDYFPAVKVKQLPALFAFIGLCESEEEFE